MGAEGTPKEARPSSEQAQYLGSRGIDVMAGESPSASSDSSKADSCNEVSDDSSKTSLDSTGSPAKLPKRQSSRSPLPAFRANQSFRHSSEERKTSIWSQKSSLQHIAPQHKMDLKHITQTLKTTFSTNTAERMTPESDESAAPPAPHKFPNRATEALFAFALCMTQFLAEYLISGFALQLPELSKRFDGSGTGALWPAAMLSLVMGAMLLLFARLSDQYGGYYFFMFASLWLTIWTLIPGFNDGEILLDASRAMQGLALAAYMPSTFAILGKLYVDGSRKRHLLCIFSAFNPLGFYGGFLIAGALPSSQPSWYFIIGAILSLGTLVAAFFSIPRKQTTGRNPDVHMDWLGSFFIAGGLILVTYALAAEPYADAGFAAPKVIAPFVIGIACLAGAVWIELKIASCPLLPWAFFTPRAVAVKKWSVGAFTMACMCFYAAFGTWLYFSSDYLQNPITTRERLYEHHVLLGVWYTPLAIAGIILCVISGQLFTKCRTEIILFGTALTWIAAPTLLALAPLPLHYWSFVMPSMLCATIGINLTFTISCVFLSKVQPAKYQGLCGAVCSMLLGLALAFSLPLAQIIMTSASGMNWIRADAKTPDEYSSEERASILVGFRAAFWYATGSAGLGLVLCVLFVRFPKQEDAEKAADKGVEGAVQLDVAPSNSPGRERDV